MPKFKDAIYDFAVYAGKFIKSRGLFSLKISKLLSQRSKFFGIIQFLQEHRNELVYLGRDRFKLLDLDEVFSIKCSSLRSLDLYFRERSRMKFFKRDHQVYVQVSDFIFAIPFPHGIYELVETFYRECYGTFDIQDGNVVDVGAFIGDTAIYFAGRGAKRVIAFEPAKHLFEMALQNVKLNGFNNIVNVRNEAIGMEYGEGNFYYTPHYPGASSMLPRNKDFICYKVRVVPLSSVMTEFDHIDLLKIDCEGMEDEILLHAFRNGLLKDISSIIVEVHGLQKLKCIIEILRKTSYKIIKHGAVKNLHLLSATKA